MKRDDYEVSSSQRRLCHFRFVTKALVSALLLAGCASQKPATQTSVESKTSQCDLATARPFIARWFGAWDLTSREMMRLPDVPPPNFILFDSTCVYTTSGVTAPGVAPVDGPPLRGAKLRWRATAHHDSLTLPDSAKLPVALMSFASADKKTGPFFVMALPPYWGTRADQFGLTPVFLHEFAHTRQTAGMAHILGPVDSAWAFPEPLNDDVLQARFKADSVYVAAFTEESDLLYRAAAANSLAECRVLATEALAMMRSRHARWFTGENEVFVILDSMWLSFEGAGQWAGYAWLSHPKGGAIDSTAAVEKMRGRRRWWSQEEGLGLFLVLNRLLPTWPSLVFNTPSMGAIELLERAVQD